MSTPKDDNAAAQQGTLPGDPEAGTGAPIDVKAKGQDQQVTRTKPRPIGEIAQHAYQVMMRRASGDEKPIATPWPDVNDALRGGFWPGLYTLTSATGMGKTQWALQAAIGAAVQFYKEPRGAGSERADRVVYVALELGPVDLVARTLGVLSQSNFDVLKEHGYRKDLPPRWSDLYFGRDRDGTPIPEDITAAVAAFESWIEAYPLDIETADAIGWNYLDLQRVIESDRGKVRMVVLDYSQLVCAPEREELRQTIGNVARVGRDLARKHGCAVLALSSTSRDNYDKVAGVKEGEQPEWLHAPEKLVALGKESGELEYTADIVLALARTSEADAHLVIAKGRGVPKCTVPLRWDGSLFWQREETEATFMQRHNPTMRTNGKRARGAR